MKGLFGACAAAAAATLLSSGNAQAQVIVSQRCNIDSLSPAEAEKRLAWARRCALDQHVMDPYSNFDNGAIASNGGTLQDYVEPSPDPFWGVNSYAAHADGLEVNNSFINKLYNSGASYQARDYWNYFYWWRPDTRKKLRPLYPTYGSSADINSPSNILLFPSATNDPADCKFYTNSARTVVHTGGFYLNGFCEASCYTPEQEVLFSDGYAPIVDAMNARREDVVTLAPGSSLDNIQLKTGQTHSYTAEFRDSTHPIVELRTASGGLLRVTVEHPVVTGDGRLVAAQTLKVGDELVKADGTMDAIVDVSRTKHYGRVYNLRPASEERVSNLLVAEGYLVGSSLFQNDEVDYINRIILHRHVPAHVIP